MEGQRVASSEGGGRLPWIIAGAAACVLAAAYLGLCAWAGSRDTILPNVSVAGLDVSNMTVEQAQQAVRTAADQHSGDIDLTLEYEGISRTVSASSLPVDEVRSVQNAWDVGHGNFLAGGPQLISHMLGASSQVPLELAEEDTALDSFLLDMEKAVADASEDSGYQIETDRLVMTKGAAIAAVDWDGVRADVQTSIQDAYRQVFSGESPSVSSTLTLSAEQSEGREPDFEAIHRAVYTQPKDASLDLETMEITDDVVGVDFDVQALKSAYQNARGGETISVPLTLTQPKVTKEALGGSLFADLLGEATSNVGGVASRLYNVTLSANSCNGVILLPGEVFSYNDTTGPRTVANGYQMGYTYVAGKSVLEPGGGVCQTSSTLYYAVLHTELEIVERRCHQYAVGYVPDGMDATVYDGGADFKFKNNTDYPIKILAWTYDTGGKRYITVQIYGTNPSGRYAVPTNSVYDVVAPTTVYVARDSVPRGSLILDTEQNSYKGRKAQTYRTIYEADGTKVETQTMGSSSYKMRPNTYYYNPLDGDPTTWVNGVPPTDPVTDPGVTDPGTTDPGTTDPGTTDPGTTDPGTADPGTTDPGTTDPGTTDPGTTVEPPVEQEPSDSGLVALDPNAEAV